MVVHESGAKGERDRAKAQRDYRLLCRYFWVWPLRDSETARMTNKQLYNLCEGIFNRQSQRAKERYAEKMYGKSNVGYRRKPFAFKWFLYDLMMLSNPEKRVLNFFLSPFKYIRLRWRNAEHKRFVASAQSEGALADAKEREKFFGPGSEPAEAKNEQS